MVGPFKHSIEYAVQLIIGNIMSYPPVWLPLHQNPLLSSRLFNRQLSHQLMVDNPWGWVLALLELLLYLFINRSLSPLRYYWLESVYAVKFEWRHVVEIPQRKRSTDVLLVIGRWFWRLKPLPSQKQKRAVAWSTHHVQMRASFLLCAITSKPAHI